jgi:PAS domain-containing protein
MSADDLEIPRLALIARGFRESRQPMLMADAGGRVVAASQGAAQLIGLPPENLSGEICADWFLPEGALSECTMLGAVPGWPAPADAPAQREGRVDPGRGCLLQLHG